MPNPALARYNADSPAGQSIDFGTQDVVIPSTTGNVTYILEEKNHVFFDSEWQTTNNALSIPNKQSGRQAIPTVDLNLQCTGNAGLPNGFAEFTAIAKNGVTITWIVAKIVSVTKNDGTPSSITVAARYKLN